MSTYTDQAIEILRLTRDGDDLAPRDLALIQLVANGQATGVSEAADVAFAELYANATKAGGYTRPWFWGIEHLTKDHQGYVYWKGHQVEHYSFYGEDAYEREKAAAERLAQACRECEARGQEVKFANLIFERPPVGKEA